MFDLILLEGMMKSCGIDLQVEKQVGAPTLQNYKIRQGASSLIPDQS